MIAVIDIDTILYNSALAAQQNYVIVKHKSSGKEREFSTQTEFFGHYAKKDGGWLAVVNAHRQEKGLTLFTPEEFEITHHSRLISDDGIPPEAIAKGRFKSTINWILEQDWCDDFIICYGTGKNFRYDVAQTQPYKHGRPPKPLLLREVTDYMLYKYKDNIVLGENMESDDVIARLLFQSYLRAGRDLDKVDCVGVACDKDLNQVPSILFNFQKPEEGLRKVTPLEAAFSLGKQMCMGDSTDSILGLPQIVPELCIKYELRKSKTVGETTALNYLKGCVNPKEIFERVVEAYRAYYGDEKKEFISFRGDKTERNWLDHADEQFQLLRMRTSLKPNPHFSEFLNSLGVQCE